MMTEKNLCEFANHFNVITGFAMRKNLLNIGIVGLDTSHVEAFTEILNNPRDPHHVEGGTITVAFPGGSPDFLPSHSRVDRFTERLRDDFGVRIVESPEEVAEACDAILLESVDGRSHRPQFEAIAPAGKPVFIDKPFAVTVEDAEAIAMCARSSGVPLMSCSSLRYAEALTVALNDDGLGSVVGAEFFGPMAIEPTQPGYFWYGIHTVEMLYATLGPGCVRVTGTTSPEHDLAVGRWGDGRIGSVRGNRVGNSEFGGFVHRQKGSQPIEVKRSARPFYASLVEKIVEFFRTGVSPVGIAETIEMVRFMEAANRCRGSDDGEPIR